MHLNYRTIVSEHVNMFVNADYSDANKNYNNMSP